VKSFDEDAFEELEDQLDFVMGNVTALVLVTRQAVPGAALPLVPPGQGRLDEPVEEGSSASAAPAQMMLHSSVLTNFTPVSLAALIRSARPSR
jgi:hypothetical protein